EQAALRSSIGLFDPRLVVLPRGPGAADADMPAATPGQERLIEELTAVVAVPFAKREGKASPQVPHALRDAVIVHPPNGLQLGPAGRDIDRHQRGEMKPRGGCAALEDG